MKLAEERVEAIVALRRLRMTAAEIAELLGRLLSRVSGILSRAGLGPTRPRTAAALRVCVPGRTLHIDVR
jgi:hypothetical protein